MSALLWLIRSTEWGHHYCTSLLDEDQQTKNKIYQGSLLWLSLLNYDAVSCWRIGPNLFPLLRQLVKALQFGAAYEFCTTYGMPTLALHPFQLVKRLPSQKLQVLEP